MSYLMAAIYDRMMSRAEGSFLRPWRHDLISHAYGKVLEIGAGTGANHPYYSSEVRQIVGTDPDPHMLAKLSKRPWPMAGVKTEWIEASVEDLPFESGSFDTVVATFVLCSVHDVMRALTEIRRMLRPGGRYLFLEHVAASEGSLLLRLQRGIEPMYRRISGNCHLTRQPHHQLESAGFVVNECTTDLIPIGGLIKDTVRGIATAC